MDPLELIINALKQHNKKKEAESLLDTFAEISSILPQLDLLSKLYFELRKTEKAINLGLRALQLCTNPHETDAIKSNLAKCYNIAGNPEKTLEYLPVSDTIDYYTEKSLALFLCNRKDESKKLLKSLLLRSDITEKQRDIIEFNLGIHYLKDGNYKEGFYRTLIIGRKFASWLKQNEKSTNVTDELTPNIKDLLVVSEAGNGDEFINIRFMKYLKEKGINATWYTDRKDLAELFRRNGFQTTSDPIRRQTELKMYSMILPYVLELKEDELFYGKYLTADETLVEKHKNLFNTNNLKIGIRWSGNPEYEHDLHRSLPLVDLYNTVKDFGTIYSLQKDNDMEDIDKCPNLIDLSPHMNSWEDTLAIIENLDIVVTSCTSIAHAAGAIGKKTIVLTPVSEYYTWLKDGVWYDNTIIIRQNKIKDWVEPLIELKAKLL